jgi:hypothetical protein
LAYIGIICVLAVAVTRLIALRPFRLILQNTLQSGREFVTSRYVTGRVANNPSRFIPIFRKRDNIAQAFVFSTKPVVVGELPLNVDHFVQAFNRPKLAVRYLQGIQLWLRRLLYSNIRNMECPCRESTENRFVPQVSNGYFEHGVDAATDSVPLVVEDDGQPASIVKVKIAFGE